MTQLDELIAKAKNWQAQDPDPKTKKELQDLIDKADQLELNDRFASRLGFGTAGLRGQLGAGPNRMNRVLVAQAAIGLARYLKANFDYPSCVIGFDARKNSDVFAKDSAEILAGYGIRVFLFDGLAATPMVSFAVRELGCSAGVMVTASHNPPADNGYKVFDHTGSQIISPVDREIASQIENFANHESVVDLVRSDSYSKVQPSVTEDYIQGISGLLNMHSERKRLNVVYSAMHGVGASFFEKIFLGAGLGPLIQVESQKQPDGTFPTVSFPNPEEPGAMDESLATARAKDADLILVNDPDADRLAVAYKNSSGELVTLTGDEVGLLLGEELAARASREGKGGTLACSIVSSSALGEVAKHYGLDFVQTLTGFKWIARVPNLVFGYEEALGYCVDWKRVKDKDGLSAALVIADIATSLAAQGYTLGDQLTRLQQRYGYFATGQISMRFSDLAKIKELMQRLRSNPINDLAGSRAEFRDLSAGSSDLPATDAIRIDLADGRSVIVRPSGTEPKLKCYLQSVSNDEAKAKQGLADLRQAMEEVLG